MASSDTGGGVVDCSVGSIVWVRRRNGSWWPGKILGPDELSASHITSPRSGTPVKLLGREDASVDWYNLEKSKRVKAFRCGEFDDCIERAEAAQGMPPKKREKYARREDAIMHALELEKHLVEKNHGNSDNSSWTRTKASPDGVNSSNNIGNGGGNEDSHLSDPACQNLGLPDKNEMHVLSSDEKLREGNQLHGEGDSSASLPRMRGLEDFGLSAGTGEELSRVAPRPKRSKYSHVQYGFSGHKEILSSPVDAQFSKVEESYPGDFVDDQRTESTEGTETDCSETDSLESDSDEDLTELSDGSISIELHPKYPGRSDLHEDRGSFSSTDDIDFQPYANGSSHAFSHEHVTSGSEGSKQRLKRKRKVQTSGKRAPASMVSEVSRGYLSIGNSKGRSVSKNDFMGKTSHIRGFLSSNEIKDFGPRSLKNHSAIRGYWEDSQEYMNSSFGGKQTFGTRFMLVDVDLQVNANNYRRNVPMISLTSKLNGHAIIGHPIQVETLESGSIPNYLTSTGYLSSEPLESPTLTSVWSTGRRTANFRVPRPFLSPRLNGHGEENAQLSHEGLSSDLGNLHQKPNVPHRSYYQSLLDKKSVAVPLKHIAASNLKIRSLSSIPAEDKHQNTDGLIRTGNVPTAVSCIPVNLVFSRLHEGLVDRHQ